MYQAGLIVRTKLTPPRQQKYTLPRPRLTKRLLDAKNHRLTILQAGTGYGKSTAVSALANEPFSTIWYRLDAEDADPQLLLLHLVHGFREELPQMSDAPVAMLEAWDSVSSPGWMAVVDVLVSELERILQAPTFLILDDVHLLNESSAPMRILDRLIGLAPHHLHVLLSSRYPLQLPTMLNWRVKGEVLEISQAELAFTPTEIDALFRQQYDYSLTLEQASLLVNRIEGWPIALHLIWQRLQRDGGATLPQALTQLSGSASDLFAYLTQEVLAQQAPDIQQFLRETAVLRQMTAASCDALRSANDSAEILQYLVERGLFVVNQGGGQIRYHHLFRELLLNQLEAAQALQLNRRAADYFIRLHEEEEAIYYYLQAKADEETAVIVDQIGREMVRVGRLETLAGWIGALSPVVLANHPMLLVYLGDIDRLHSRFDSALNWYKQAEERSRFRGDISDLGRALRGQARVYLDTVNATQAEELLKEALQLSDGEQDRASRARLLELLAENLLNSGRTEEAGTYQAQARELREAACFNDNRLPVRMLLRTGRLNEAARNLADLANEEEMAPVKRPRAHRETALLRSLVAAFMGDVDVALETAVTGISRGKELDSSFTTSVGFSRRGHALLLRGDSISFEEARRSYEEAIALSRAINVVRLEVEPYWGLCKLYGYRGDLEQAEQVARRGIEIVQADGDVWVESGVRTSMGISFALGGEYEQAISWLEEARTGFQECSDLFGETAVLLWQCYIWLQRGDQTRFERDSKELFQLVNEYQYDFLFLQRTFFGPPDTRMLVPLLLYVRENFQKNVVVNRLLMEMGLSQVEMHPGYHLRINTLGAFQLWRGSEEVPSKAWRRKKARQLFQLLLTYRGNMLHRDQITTMLWPDLDQEGALRDFKIAFSAMCSVLEPNRKRNAPSAFVSRDGSRYGLRMSADMWVDVIAFETAVSVGDRLYQKSPEAAVPHYQTAYDLYTGDFLQAYPYEEWCNDERDRLQSVFLQTSERLAEGLSLQNEWEAVVAICQSILVIDDCWEHAYQLLMTAYQTLGKRTLAIRTYQQCETALTNTLSVPPTVDTYQIYQSILQE